MKVSIWGVVLSMVIWAIPAVAQEKGMQFVEDKSWQEVLSIAGQENKLIFLDCYTTWCGPCKAMAKDVFPQPEVGDFMNANFINVKMDMEKGEGLELSKKYKKFIPGYPTFLLINGQGDVVHQVAGYNAPDKFIEKMKEGLQQKSWIAYTVKYQAGERSWEFLQTYLQSLEDAYQKADVKQVVEATLPQLTLQAITENESAYRIFRKYWNNAESPMLVTFLASPAIYRKYKDPEKEVNEWGGRLFKSAVDKYIGASTTPDKFDAKAADEVLNNLRNLHVSGRENMIALLKLSKAVAAYKPEEFVKTLNSAKEFGMLRYDSRAVSTWTKYMASKTQDKKLLDQYLSAASFNEKDNLVSHDDIRNYAYILERKGDKEKAAAYYKEADKKEAELKERFKGLLGN